MKFPTEWKVIKVMFQTTKQLLTAAHSLKLENHREMTQLCQIPVSLV
jgi:hypothetical protein